MGQTVKIGFFHNHDPNQDGFKKKKNLIYFNPNHYLSTTQVQFLPTPNHTLFFPSVGIANSISFTFSFFWVVGRNRYIKNLGKLSANYLHGHVPLEVNVKKSYN